MRVVLDTNVLISAIFFSGPPSRILSAWLEDKFELAVSAEILAEYRGTATRIGEKFPQVDVAVVLDRIALHALLVLPVGLPDDACEDRDDVKFLACALGARAQYVVTGDRALLRTSGYQGIEVVSPRRFLAQHLT
ncbi:MAG: putative toxin-antitoxin system toxin component, PIN family [Acidobacteriia bacterium]|nr:putative toxin-antitoxin system toxin component, PIN family [Terriglobia bacterium]